MKINFIHSLIVTLLFISCKTTETIGTKDSQVITKTFYSVNLQEDRDITFYLPNGYNDSHELPIVYCTDGQIIVNAYKKELDSLISNGVIPKIIIAGVHSNERDVKNSNYQFRHYEYIESWSDTDNELLNKIFQNHLKFFSEEVIEFAEEELNVSKISSNRIFYGTSNGAGFGVSLSAAFPSLFQKYICFSMAGGDFENISWPKENYPYFYLACGKEEPIPFVMAADEFHSYLDSNNYDHDFYKFEGGHDRDKWKKEFVRILAMMYEK